MPDNVRQTGLTGYIRSKRKQLLRSSDVTMAIRLIEARRLPDTKEYEEKHIANQKARFSAPIAKETTKRTGL